MIKANELRIGNFVTAIRCDNSQIIDQVKQLHESYVMTKFDWDKVEPIPLDEEWLLKFGFKKSFSKFDDGFEINEMILNNTYDKDCDGWCFYDGNVACCNNMNYKNPIKHVHQLQNLYFALTGEELTTKNKTK